MSESYDLVIRGADIVTPAGPVQADLGIKNGRIAELGRELSGQTVIDAGGLIATPGGVDPHAHIEQRSGMGLMNADTFETATRSAALGATTTVVSFAAQGRGERLREVVADYSARAERGAYIDYAFHIILSDPTAPHFEDDLQDLIKSGHRSVKLFTTYDIALDESQIRRVFAICASEGALACIHAEDDEILKVARNTLIQNGKILPKHHAEARPRSAESKAVADICALAEQTQTRTMIFHVTCIEALDAVAAAKARGAPIWAETCPHYLLQTAEILDQPSMKGAKFMCSPPQRAKADVEALKRALIDGRLDIISSDHAPYRFDETGKFRNGPSPAFPDIANGQPGLETRQPLMFEMFEPSDFVLLTAETPAALHNLAGKGTLKLGADADIALWDPAKSYTYNANDLHANVGYNPHEGQCVNAWPVHVFLRGNQIVTDGKLTAEPGQGRWIKRSWP